MSGSLTIRFTRKPNDRFIYMAEAVEHPEVYGYGSTIVEACRSLLDSLLVQFICGESNGQRSHP